MVTGARKGTYKLSEVLPFLAALKKLVKAQLSKIDVAVSLFVEESLALK